MAYTISKESMALLLDRSLSDYESNNFSSLLDSSKNQLESILGIKIDGTADVERTYMPRFGYATLWTDPFSELTSISVVKPDGSTRLLGTPSYFDDLNSKWYNSIILDRPMGSKRLVVKAAWGFGSDIPADLAKLWAGLFGIHSEAADTAPSGAITSEQILTHKVTFSGADIDSLINWKAANATVIARYSLPTTTVYGEDDGFQRLY